MIRIKVTDEMVMELRTDPEDQGHACQCEKCTPGNLARVLAIVERDLNAAMVMLGQFGGVAARSGSVEIEVTQ